MKIASCSDVHFHAYKEHATADGGCNSRLKAAGAVWDSMIKKAEGKGAELVAFCGDMFHVRGMLRPSTLSFVYARMVETCRRMAVAAVPGNHDMENYKGGATAMDAFEAISGFSLLAAPDGASLAFRDCSIVGVPYTHDYGQFRDNFARMVAEYSPKVAMIHQYIDNFTPAIMPKTGLTCEWIDAQMPAGTTVLCGHYHEPIRWAGENCHVVNVGALMPNNFGETSNYGFWLIDTDGDVPEFCPVDSPRFVTIERKPRDLESAVKGAYVRIVGKKAAATEKLKEACLEAGALSVVVRLVKEFATAHERTIKVSGAKEMIAEYCEIMGGQYAAKRSEILNLYDEVAGGVE